MRARWIVGLLGAFLLVSCLPSVDPPRRLDRVPVATPTGTSTIVIGLVGTMSGPDAWRGEDAFEGADLGVHVLNRELPEEARPYELVTLDDRGSARLAQSHIERLAGDERTAGIVYAGPPEGLPPAGAVLQEAGIPAILCYGDLASGGLLKGPLFQMSAPYLAQAQVLTRYLVADRGYRRIGVLNRDSISGATAARALAATVRSAGGTLIRAGLASGERQALIRLRQRRVQAVVVEGSPSDWSRLVAAVEELDAQYETTEAARRSIRRRSAWRPQMAGFDLGLVPAPPEDIPPSGTVVSDSLARGAHLLPIPSLERFRSDFSDWWGSSPLGWELRSYDAVRAIGWAWERSPSGRGEVARTLESLRGVRFGGLDLVLGPGDHVFPDDASVGLWVVPRPGAGPDLPQAGPSLPWIPLARSWSTRGGRTTLDAQDWRYLFSGAPGPRGAAPRFGRFRFGVTTPQRDRVH